MLFEPLPPATARRFPARFPLVPLKTCETSRICDFFFIYFILKVIIITNNRRVADQTLVNTP
ncbi:hypothetical protein DDI_1485 [Dickeya dianthicola RNS04.9]|nr:hypothetical protein DDI_1485 [Dickeya dianthicola RNS04.9]